MGRFVLVLIIIGAVLTFAGVQEMRLSSAAKPEPQEISCSELIENGPGDNAHVLLRAIAREVGGFVSGLPLKR